MPTLPEGEPQKWGGSVMDGLRTRSIPSTLDLRSKGGAKITENLDSGGCLEEEGKKSLSGGRQRKDITGKTKGKGKGVGAKKIRISSHKL